MEPDEWTPPKARTADLLKEDLSMYSLKELRERVALLKAEIERCEAMIEGKEGARSDAESFFRK
ncbi:MAG: DUF1192 domain-containing protein [Alphaproteobacteria bacterium]